MHLSWLMVVLHTWSWYLLMVINTKFSMEKSQLATVKTVSLPRLEEMTFKKATTLPLSTFKYWTDSTTILQYITDKSHRLKVYVPNQVAWILECTDTGNWQHNDGKMNPADMCTRGLLDPGNPLQWNKHGKSWLLGPDFLTKEH